jgi:chorismate mutase/prephenate dehydrogenase
MSDGSERTRPLPVLRAIIDSIDHELLRLIARRMAVVGEIAEYKREHALKIRDFPREREIISDRRSHGRQLGLPPDAIESFFRVVLWASREHQAALRAEVPPEIEPRTVAVIGGRGGMGSLMVRMFSDLGHAVMVADLDTELSPEDAAAMAEVVIISVPIEVTVEVVRRLGPRVRADSLLMDVTSVKEGPLQAMLESTDASVVGTHPMFGPSVHSLQGQRAILCRGRGDEWFEWVKQMYEARGLVTKEARAHEHDLAMAVVQVLTHFQTETMGRTLLRLGVSLEETLSYTSPIYLIELMMTVRHFAQSPLLYADIAMSNPRSQEVTGVLAEMTDEWREILARKDAGAFKKLFEEVRDYFGPLTDQALEQSSFLIDRLVERS